MRPIPPKIRNELSNDKFMEKCIYSECNNSPEWEHAIIYSGKQVNEIWSIIPCCKFHHRERGLDKTYNKYIAFKKLFDSNKEYVKEQLKKYPKNDWVQQYKYLMKKYEQP